MLRSDRGMGGWRRSAAGNEKDVAGGVGGGVPAAVGTGRPAVDRRSLLRWAGT